MATTYSVSIIIPVFNEEEGINYLVQELNKQSEKYSFTAELIFVDDGSEDSTIKKLKASAFSPKVASKIVKLSKNFGSHAALRAGISVAKGDYITFLPADLQDPPELSQSLFNEMNKGNDIVWAQRSSTQSAWGEKQFSLLYARLMKRFVSKKYPSQGFDVVMFNSKVKSFLLKNEETNSSIFLQILTAGFQQSYIEYDKNIRKTGKSKWTLTKKIKLLIDSFAAFSYAPIRFVTVMGFTFFLIGLCWTGFILYRKIFVGDVASGWPALVSILFFGFGVTNISLGIIAEYLWRTFDVSRNRPVFIIDEITELNTHDN